MNYFDSLRNVLIPLGVARPIKSKKYLFVTVVSILLSIPYKYLTISYINSVILDFMIIASIIGTVSFIYDKLYYQHYAKKFDSKNIGVVIGQSNTVLILEGQEVLEEYNCDMVIIRSADTLKDKAFVKQSSVIECVQNNKITTQIIVDKIEEFEKCVLLPNLDRVGEDIEVIYE